MNLRLIREPSIDGATHGSLYIDGHWCCWTLEDQIREQPGTPVAAWKVLAQTAIPSGRYRVTLTASHRFQRVLPEIHDVPGFRGIRIHTGNVIGDTEGCLLVGQDRRPGRVLQSRIAYAGLEAKLASARDIWIAIENPQVEQAV